MAMGIQFEEAEYAGVPEYFRLVIIFLRSSVGDINAPFILFGKPEELKWGSLSVSDIDNATKQKVILTLMWVQFVMGIYFMNIILLNFLISVIQSSHEKSLTR